MKRLNWLHVPLLASIPIIGLYGVSEPPSHLACAAAPSVSLGPRSAYRSRAPSSRAQPPASLAHVCVRALLQLLTVPLRWQTLLLSIAYYVFSGIGITGG